MKAQVYSAYTYTFTILVSTHRTEAAPATKFTAATIHEDFSGQVRAHLREWKHCGESAQNVPAALRLSTYLPIHNGESIFVLKEIMPAGTSREIDGEWQVEVTRLRYSGAVHLTRIALVADEVIVENFERALEYAVSKLLKLRGVPFVFIPGDQDTRPADMTEVDIVAELGPAIARVGAEVPVPVDS